MNSPKYTRPPATLPAELDHALRQPLNALGLYLATAREQLRREQPEPATAALAQAQAEVKRLQALLSACRAPPADP